MNLLDQFQNNVQTTLPPNCVTYVPKEGDDPDTHGWFIPAESSESASLNVIDRFTPARVTLGGEEVDGFLIKNPRFVVLHRGNINVLEKVEGGWKQIGPAYLKGTITKYGTLARDDRDNYRLQTQYLLCFVDENNQILHDIPFSISMGRGAGASFSEELKIYYRKVEDLVFGGKRGYSLDSKAKALMVLELKLAVNQQKGKSGYLCPVGVTIPSDNGSIGTTQKLTRTLGREVTADFRDYRSLIINRESDTGHQVEALWSDYEDALNRIEIAKDIDD